LTDSLEDLLEGKEARVSGRLSGTKERIDGRELEKRFGDSRYSLKPTDGFEERYSLMKGEKEPDVWYRSVFSLGGRASGSDEKEGELEEEIEMVVETKGEEPSWGEGDELTVGAGALKHEPVRVNHVAGLEEEKEELRRFLDGIDDEVGLSEQTGIILEGPPGTGKTELVREMCQERYGSVPVTVSGPEILSKWVGESERALREKFEEAQNTRHKVLYIDELDAIARSRDESSESHSTQIVAQLMVLLDGVEAKKESEERDEEDENNLKVIASTNISHVVDPALRRPGRLGNRPIRFRLPDKEERRAILHHYLEDVHASRDGKLGSELEAFVTRGESDELEKLIELKTEGFTGADIEDWVRESVKEVIEEGGEALDVGTMEKVLEEGGFGRERDFEENVIELDEDGISNAGSRATVCRMDGRTPEKIVRDEGDSGYRYRHRRVTPSDLLESDFVRSKENVIQAFQHHDDERLLLEVDDWEILKQARKESEMAERLIGIMHEELLKWEKENILLLTDETAPEYLKI